MDARATRRRRYFRDDPYHDGGRDRRKHTTLPKRGNTTRLSTAAGMCVWCRGGDCGRARSCGLAFPYADRDDWKTRPAVVLGGDRLRGLIFVAPVTTSTGFYSRTAVEWEHWDDTDLYRRCAVRRRRIAVERADIYEVVGALAPDDWHLITEALDLSA